jgi:hypothetical protein
MARSRVLLLFLLPWLACVDRADFVSDVTDLPVIIDGLFSNESAEVRLSKGYPVNGTLNYTRIPNATVWITDTEDITWRLDLPEQKLSFDAYQAFNGTIYGVYENVAPLSGHQYVLHVRVGADEYVSAPQRVEEPGTVDRIYYDFTSGFNPSTELEEDALIIRFDASVPAGEERFFQWRMYGTFSVPGNPAAGPSRCWVTEREEFPILSSKAYGNRYAGMTARHVPITYDRFNDQYRVEIRQYEVTREVWEFAEAMRFQLKNASSLFQPPFFIPEGNIAAVNGQKSVLGIFSAALDARRYIVIRRSDLPRKVYGQPIDGSCLQVYPGSLPYPPSFWK